jgi:chitinase
VTQNPWDFTAYTVAFANSAPVTEPTPTPTPTPTTPGFCTAAPWSSSTTYVSGDVVSCDGDQWTANQWNYDEVPGGSSGAWGNDGAC